jgi:tRNA A37 methylthiotransferase MiaB
MPREKVFFRTFGCQMNVRDSEVICGLLRQGVIDLRLRQGRGHHYFNTCSVRQHARTGSGALSAVTRGKNNRPSRMHGQIIGKAFERDSSVDFVVGPQDIHKFTGILESSRDRNILLNARSGRWIAREAGRDLSFRVFQDKEHAYVVIQKDVLIFALLHRALCARPAAPP